MPSFNKSNLSSGLLSAQYLEDPDIIQDGYKAGPTGLFIYSYNGYWYLYEPMGDKQGPDKTKISKYTITAFPTRPNKTGVRRIKITQDGKLFIEEYEPGKVPTLIPYSD